MSFVANPFVVVLDANVLFPFRVRDVLLTFAQDGLFRARITDEIMDEGDSIVSKHIEKKFEVYHRDNPHVYDLFIKFSTQAKESGKKQYSAKSVFERMRWHVDIETVGETFKLNNNYTAYYARKIMQDYSEFYNFFSIRELK